MKRNNLTAPALFKAVPILFESGNTVKKNFITIHISMNDVSQRFASLLIHEQ